MLLGGLQKNSLIDYPGKLSCVLFLSGCNFDCPFCHNPELARGCQDCPALLQEDGVFDFLETRKGFLDGVVISGGEPTLHHDLTDLCGRIKSMGYPVKLDTNGSRPEAIGELLEKGLVDYIAMDIKTDPLQYEPWIRKTCDPGAILSSIRMIMERAPAYEFRTTCVKPFINDVIIEQIARTIRGATLYALQHFEDGHLLHPEFFRNRDSRFSEGEMARLKDIVTPYVRSCVIR